MQPIWVHGSWCHWPAEQGEAWELRAQMGKLSPTGLHSFETVSVFLLRAMWEAQFPLVSLRGGDVDEGSRAASSSPQSPHPCNRQADSTPAPLPSPPLLAGGGGALCSQLEVWL